jgi:nucleoside 2-deoxyribosyltransferase
MKTIYLCGGIKDLSKSEASEWREYATQELGNKRSFFQVMAQGPAVEKNTYNFNFLNPMRRNFRSNEWQSQNEIVTLDKKDILEADILLVNATKPSWGTAMEVMFGFMHNKIIICFTGSDNSKDWNPWLGYHSTKLTKDLNEAIEYIKKNFKEDM